MLAARRMMLPRHNFWVIQDGELAFRWYIPGSYLTGTNVGMAQAGDTDSSHFLWDSFSSSLGTSIADTFNRTDSTTSLGTASDGGTWTLTPSQQWGIVSNQAYSSSDSTGLLTRFGSSTWRGVYRDSGSVACDITFRFGFTNAVGVNGGLLFGYDGGVGVNGNAYILDLRASSTTTARLRQVSPSDGISPPPGSGITSDFAIKDIGSSSSTFRVVFRP